MNTPQRFDLDQCYSCQNVYTPHMNWQVHYQSRGQQFSAPVADRSTAMAIPCILIRDGHDVLKAESTTGEAIEMDEIYRLCG